MRNEIAEHKVDVVSGATVATMVMDGAILRSPIKVARAHGLGCLAPERKRPDRAR